MKKYLVLLAAYVLLAACDSPKQLTENEESQQEISQEMLARQAMLARQQSLEKEISQLADSLSGQMASYTSLVGRLQDSIDHTGVHPMQQEETINRYRNVQRHLRDAQKQLKKWQAAPQQAPDSLSGQEKTEYLIDRLTKLQAIRQRLNSAMAGAYVAMQENSH